MQYHLTIASCVFEGLIEFKGGCVWETGQGVESHSQLESKITSHARFTEIGKRHFLPLQLFQMTDVNLKKPKWGERVWFPTEIYINLCLMLTPKMSNFYASLITINPLYEGIHGLQDWMMQPTLFFPGIVMDFLSVSHIWGIEYETLSPHPPW